MTRISGVRAERVEEGVRLDAGKTEDGVDALPQQRLDDRVTAGHVGAPGSRGRMAATDRPLSSSRRAGSRGNATRPSALRAASLVWVQATAGTSRYVRQMQRVPPPERTHGTLDERRAVHPSVDAGERRRFFHGLWLLAALGAIFAIWVETGLGGKETAVHVDDLATMVAALVAAVFCARAARKHAGRIGVFWWLLSAACVAWTLGEGIWSIYDFSGGVPVSSWADAAYLAALLPTAAALLVHPAMRGRAIAKSRSLVDGLLLAAALFFLSWTLVLEPVQRTTDLTSLDGLVTLAYPLGDVVIVFLIVLVIRGTMIGERQDLWCLLAGLLAITCSDAVYSYLTNVANYSSGNVIDVGWFVGYLGLALGALCSRSDHVTERRRQASPSLSTPAVVAPFLPLLAALALAGVRIQLGYRLDGVTLTIAFVLVGLVLVRQSLLVVDLFAAERELEGDVPGRLLVALGGGGADRSAELSSTPRGLSVTGPPKITVMPRAASAPARGAAQRRKQRDSQALIVAVLTLLATGIAFYDLALLAAGLQ